VSTLAHEWGHAMHAYLANSTQPYPTARYATFTAEIASTFNEALLLDLMLRRAESDTEKLYYLGSALESLRGTFYRQTMFAEFELAMHEKALAGEALSGDSLTALYATILKRYHGHEQGVVNIDDAVTMEWAFIPHFYRNFYVYQYATSLAASSLLSESVLRQEPGAVDRYLDLLRAGGADYPYELLKAAGVDMATPDPYQAVVRRMNRIMDDIESILDRQHAAP
jgi:oligoendopeptidase F